MELKKQRVNSLKSYFIKFLIHIALSMVPAVLLWLFLFSLLLHFQGIAPANQTEKQVLAFMSRLPENGHILPSDIPSGADYAFFASDGELTASSLDGKPLGKARLLASSKEDKFLPDSSGRVYVKLLQDRQTIIISYRIRATFTNPLLRRIFPNAEIFLTLALIFLLLGAFTSVTFRFARRLGKELAPLKETAEQIRLQNLDYPPARTRIREFNNVLDSLDSLKNELRDSLTAQWRVEQTKKKQIAALAHDIKTPLTIVKGNAELLSESSLTEEQRYFTDFILQNAIQMQAYLSQIIDVSRERSASPGPEACRLPALLAELEKNTKALGAKKELAVCFVPEQVPDTLPIPEDDVRRALLNVLDNAVEYSPLRGTVTLRVFKSESYHPGMLCFEITDEGPGFSEQSLLFAEEEFYREDESRGSREHHGLGLAIAGQIAEAYGGMLTLKNGETAGAIVSILLPR